MKDFKLGGRIQINLIVFNPIKNQPTKNVLCLICTSNFGLENSGKKILVYNTVTF